jgi:hypothetical protein
MAAGRCRGRSRRQRRLVRLGELLFPLKIPNPSCVALRMLTGPLFMETSVFNLHYEQERWPKIAFADVKDYQKAS